MSKISQIIGVKIEACCLFSSGPIFPIEESSQMAVGSLEPPKNMDSTLFILIEM